MFTLGAVTVWPWLKFTFHRAQGNKTTTVGPSTFRSIQIQSQILDQIPIFHGRPMGTKSGQFQSISIKNEESVDYSSHNSWISTELREKFSDKHFRLAKCSGCCDFFLPILERPVVVAVLLLVLYDLPSVFEGDRLIIWIFWWRHSPIKRHRHRHSFIAVCILFSTTSWANHDKCATSYFYFLFIYYIFFNIWIVTKWKYKGLRYSNKCLHFENSIRKASISLLIITCPIWPRSPLAY